MKKALVISGGGSKGAFAVGVLQQLKVAFPTLNFDIIVGTSAGALLTPLAALKEIDLLEKVFTSLTTDKVITQHRLGDRINETSIFTVEPLYQLIKTYVTDSRFNAIQASGTAIHIITTCLQTEGVNVYTNQKNVTPSPLYISKTIKDAEHLRLAVLASACQPLLMTPVKVDFNYTTGNEKNFQYVDGGVREFAGIQMAIDNGATEIFCILLSTGKDDVVNAAFTSLFPILQRTITILTEEVQKNDVYIPEQYAKTTNYLQLVKQRMKTDGVPKQKIDQYFAPDASTPAYLIGGAIKLFLLRPDAPLGGGPGGLVFDPVEMKGMIEKGRRVVDKFVAGNVRHET